MIGLGHARVILNIYSGISLPWCPVYPMTAATLTGLPEVPVADIAQIGEPNPFRIVAKPLEDFVGAFDEFMISTVILNVKGLTRPFPIAIVTPPLGDNSPASRTDRRQWKGVFPCLPRQETNTAAPPARVLPSAIWPERTRAPRRCGNSLRKPLRPSQGMGDLFLGRRTC